MALDLVEGFAVAVKHHLRGEMGLYYEDLYNLIQPLHEHRHINHRHQAKSRKAETIKVRPSKSQPDLRPSTSHPAPCPPSIVASSPPKSPPNNVAPPTSIYGTFNPSSSSLSLPKNHQPNGKRKSRARAQSTHSDVTEDGECNLDSEEHHLIQPSELPQPTSIMDEVEGDLIPFRSFFSSLKDLWRGIFGHGPELPMNSNQDGTVRTGWSFFSRPSNDKRAENQMMAKSRPRLARPTENVPLDVLRVLTEWVSVLESRGTVPGGLGGMYGCISSFEESLSALERILTTPLPFVYSVHIRHTVWIYLFFLPFQLLDQFGWSTIPGVGIAAFIYLGFLAAGEEIEQPFGYDENDLDLDLYTSAIIHEDMVELKKSHCRNAYHSHKATKMARSISVIVEESLRASGRQRDNGNEEYDEDGDGIGDGYGLDDAFFGIAETDTN